jgi:hypothetical protein
MKDSKQEQEQQAGAAIIGQLSFDISHLSFGAQIQVAVHKMINEKCQMIIDQ